MTKGTISREEIRETLKGDELGEAIKRSADFIQRHAKGLIALLLLIIVALIGWKVWEYRDVKAQENATLEFMKAQQDFDRGLFDPQVEAGKRTEMITQAAKGVESLRTAYPGTSAARMGLYLQAKAYLALPEKADSTENTDKALATFRQYADGAKSAEDKARGLLGVAAAYQNRAWIKNDAQDYQRAEDTYQEILKSVPATSYLAMESTLCLARLMAARGNTDKAAALYRELIAAGKKPEPEKPAEAVQNPSEKQRLALRDQIMSILNRDSYAAVAERELKEVVPASAERLGTKVPGAAPSQSATQPEAKPEPVTP